jgi:outer membrane lipoprotein carrier protein
LPVSCYTFDVIAKRSVLLVFSVALIGACGFAAGTISPDAAPAVGALEARYHNAKTLKAAFLERYSDGQQSAQLESGTVYFGRPGRMRWEYESPESKLFVSDGKTVWFFVPADRAVTRAPMKESTDWRTPLVLLTGKARLAELCDRIDLAGQPPATTGRVVLRCLPRGGKRAAAQADSIAKLATPDQQFDQVLLEVDPATGELGDVRVLEPGGIELEYRFGNWEYNIPLPDSLFRFQAPVGVAILNESAPPDATP